MNPKNWKWRIGDRVAVYSGVRRYTGTVVDFFNLGGLVGIDPQKKRNLEKDCAAETWPITMYAHSKQLRRLKPKAKKVAREVWVVFGHSGNPLLAWNEKQDLGPGTTQTQALYREVLE